MREPVVLGVGAGSRSAGAPPWWGQGHRLADTWSWVVLPDPSGLNAHWSRAVMVAEFVRL